AAALFWTLALLGLMACASHPQALINESPKGSVYLQPVVSRDFQATHPISIEPAILVKGLQRVYLSEETALEALVRSEGNAKRVFTDEDVEFLAPLLASALKRAAPNQIVAFRVRYPGPRTVPRE